MSENVSTEVLLRLLNRLPGATWAIRKDATGNKAEWIYFSPQVAELYGVTEAELRDDPSSRLKRMVPEDAARLSEQLRASLKSLSPMVWIGRIVLASGAVRWIETQSVFEREADGTIVSYGLALDVTERKGLEQALSTSEALREKSDTMYKTVLEGLGAGVIVLEPSGKFLVYNSAAERYAGKPQEVANADLSNAYGAFETDGVTPFPNERLPLIRALAGGEVTDVEMIIRNPDLPDGCWIRAYGRPLRDAAGNVVAGIADFYDVTEQRRLEKELRIRNEQLAANEEARGVLIERLRLAIEELSNPILEVWDDVLAMPIIGVVDSRRAADMVRRLLAEVARTQATFVIVDLTGVDLVDTKTADHLIKLIRKVELVGARCVLTGIRPAVSEALVDLGVDFARLTTLRNLKHGLREAIRFARRERQGLKDFHIDDDAAPESQPHRRSR